jgi:hypothetical protein
MDGLHITLASTSFRIKDLAEARSGAAFRFSEPPNEFSIAVVLTNQNASLRLLAVSWIAVHVSNSVFVVADIDAWIFTCIVHA